MAKGEVISLWREKTRERGNSLLANLTAFIIRTLNARGATTALLRNAVRATTRAEAVIEAIMVMDGNWS